MQTTLLSIAIALILALVAALVGPLLIDWGHYRPLIEAEASRVVGAGVHVAGPIDGRLLPSPRLTLHDVRIGQGPEAIHAGELTVQFALTPLMRGQWQAEEMRLAQPEMTVGVDDKGRLQAPRLAVGFAPDAVAVERLQIEGGKLIVRTAASAKPVTLDNIFFNGRARSLLGPFSGSGSLSVAGDHYSVDLSTGHYGAEGMRLHVRLQPSEHPFSIDTDGMLSFDDDKPKFDGNLSLGPPPGLAQQAKSWHVRGKLTAGTQAALLQDLQFVYGSDSGDNQPLKLTGSVRLDIGREPSLSAELTTPQLDIDRMLTGSDGARPTPAEALRKFAQWSGGAAFVSPIPVQIGLSVTEVVLGGKSLQNVGGDFNSIAGGWNLQTLEFRAPGFSQVALSGKLKVGDDGVSFSGPAVVEATDPKTLFAWWQGGSMQAAAALKPIKLRGDVTFGTDRVAVEGLQASFDGKRVNGSVTYAYAAGKTPSKLDAVLKADDLDLDTSIALGKAIAAGSDGEGPQQIALRADVRRATVSGFTAHDAKAALTWGRDGLQIESLSVGDLDGARFAAHGHIRFDRAQQRGSLTADLAAPDLKPVLALLAKAAPETAAALAPAAAGLSPANLHGTLTLADDAAPGEAKVALSGSLGKSRLSIDGSGKVDLQTRAVSVPRVDARIAADDGRVIASLLHLDHVLAVDKGPGALNVTLSGADEGALKLDARVTAAGLDATAKGTARLGDKREADLHVAIVRANAAPLREADAPVPVTLDGHMTLKGDAITLDGLRAGVGASRISGRLTLQPGEITHVGGELEADVAAAPPAIALAIGLPEAKANTANGAWRWSSDPFGAGLWDRLQGDVALRAHRLELAPHLAAREVHATLRFAPHRIAADDIAGVLAGGALKGGLQFAQGSDGLSAHATLSLTKADAAALTAADARPPLSGALSLDVTLDGSGLSPAALAGSLRGAGKVTLDNGELAGLDPRAFDAVTRAVDQGVPIDAGRIADIVGKTLDSGQLSVRHADGVLSAGAGQIRLQTVKLAGDDADATLSGALDLTNGTLDARLILSGAREAAGTRPDIYMAVKGSIAAPARTIDVSALTGWLTLRAVDNETRKLKAAEEAAARQRAADEAAAAKIRAEQAAKARAAAEAAARAAAAVPTASPKPVFPPVSPPLVLTPPAVTSTAPRLPPPVAIETLPQPPLPAVR